MGKSLVRVLVYVGSNFRNDKPTSGPERTRRSRFSVSPQSKRSRNLSARPLPKAARIRADKNSEGSGGSKWREGREGRGGTGSMKKHVYITGKECPIPDFQIIRCSGMPRGAFRKWIDPFESNLINTELYATLPPPERLIQKVRRSWTGKGGGGGTAGCKKRENEE